MAQDICCTCIFSKGTWCNRLVATSVGMRDRVGSDYKHDNTCPYHETGTPKTDNNKPQFYNS